MLDLQSMEHKSLIALLDIACRIIRFLLGKSGAMQGNTERRSYAPWMKDFLIANHEQGASWSLLSHLTGISTDTLKKLKGRAPKLSKAPMDGLSQQIVLAWESASPRDRKTLNSFWSYLGRRFPEMSISYDRMREILTEQGLRYPRGPKAANHGARVKKAFSPHALWEGDGKLIKIRLNGRSYHFCWYAFVDQATTLLVGANIDQTESSENFLEALKDGQKKAACYPIGILIDNRLKDTDMSAINAFCKKHRIEIVRTFPGNSKSNGNIENNFSIYESFVGEIEINGSSSTAIAKAIGQAIVEVFTQQRNHRGRERLGGATPSDATRGMGRPEKARSAIQKLAQRFGAPDLKEDQKWDLIEESRKQFGDLDQESEEKFKTKLGPYPVLDIVAAQASYLAHVRTHPDQSYGPEYFFGILRHTRERKAKQIYNEEYRAGITLLNDPSINLPPGSIDAASGVFEEILKAQREVSPSAQLLRLDTILIWLANYSITGSLANLWECIGKLAEASLAITLKWWGLVNDYLSERIGTLLYESDEGYCLAG